MHRTSHALFFAGLTLLLLNGCEDKAMVNVYDKSILKSPPSCLTLSVIPPDAAIEKAIRDRFAFADTCPWRLDVSYKSNIHCTSNQNSNRKALSAFPSSYVRLEIRKGMKLAYSYYVDLTQQADADDASRAMSRVLSDLFEDESL